MHKASVWGQREAVEEKEWGGMRRKASRKGNTSFSNKRVSYSYSDKQNI